MLTLYPSVDLASMLASFPLPALAVDSSLRMLHTSPHLTSALPISLPQKGGKIEDTARSITPAFMPAMTLTLASARPASFQLEGSRRIILKAFAEPFRYSNNQVAGVFITFIDVTDPATAGLRERPAPEIGEELRPRRCSFNGQTELPLAFFSPDLRLTALNQAFRNAFSCQDVPVGSPVARLQFPAVTVPLVAALRQVVEIGEDAFLSEVPVDGREGSVGSIPMEYYSIFCLACHNTPSQIQGVVVYALDNTKDVLLQKHHQAQQALAETTLMLEQKESELRDLALELCLVEERERRDLSQYLHDEVQQLIVAARLRLHRLHRELSEKEFQGTSESCAAILNECLTAIRTLSVELSPPVIYENDFAAILGWIGEMQRERFGLNVEIQNSLSNDFIIPKPLKHLLIQAIQELLFNVTKYSGVKDASLKIETSDTATLEITVEDHGKGCPAKELDTGLRKRIGLAGIQRKLEALGGKLFLYTAPGKGFRAGMVIPVKGTPGIESVGDGK